MNTIRASDRVYQGCKSQASQIGPGRAVPARKFEWTRISVGPSRAFQAQNFCRPGRAVFCQYSAKILPISAFFQRTILNFKWVINKVQIFIKKSFKTRIEIRLSMTGPRFQLGRAGQSGPKIYNPGVYRSGEMNFRKFSMAF